MPPPTTRTSKVRGGQLDRGRDHAGVIRTKAVGYSFRRGDDRRGARVLGPAHSRSRDHPASGRLARFLRRSRSVSLREAAPPAPARGLRRLSRQIGARGRLRRRRSIWRDSPGAARSRDRRRPVGRRRSSWPRANFAQQGLDGTFRGRPTASSCRLPTTRFDFVYAHGVVQYTANPQRLVDECRRVLKPGGQALFQVYNRVSWLNALSKLMKVGLEHDDAPVLLKFSIGEFRALVGGFSRRADRAGTISGEVAPSRRLEGRGLQRRVRRHVQCAAAVGGPAVRLASAGVLRKMIAP